MNPLKNLWAAVDSDDDSRVLAAMVLLVVFLIVTVIAVVGLVAWHWWLGGPLVVYLVYVVYRFATGGQQ